MPITKPTVGGDNNTWGTKLNTALDALEAADTAHAAAGDPHPGYLKESDANGTYVPVAVVTGTTSAALQAAIDSVTAGGTVLVPQGTTVTLTTPVTKSGKDFTLEIHGKLVDGMTAWTATLTDTTLTGKGLLAFGNCSVQVIGRGQPVAFDGNTGTAALKPFLYLYNCTDVVVRGINGANLTDSAILGLRCDRVTHRDCTYDGGQYPVIWSRGDHTTVDNVRATNNSYNGIVIHDRAYLGSGVLAYRRPTNVSVVNCSAYNTHATNAAAVGITVDNSDGVVAHGNDVDGNNAATMAYSWAGSTALRVYGNRAANVSTTSNGSYLYTGIGMEFDGVSDVEAFGNTFDNCLLGYLIIACDTGRFEGRLVNALTGSSNAGRSTLAQISGTGSVDVTISGVVTGCAWGIAVEGTVDGLTIRDFTARDVTNRAIGMSSGTITRLTLSNIRFVWVGAPQAGLVCSATCPVLTMDGFWIEAGTAATDNAIYYAVTGGTILLRRGYVKNYSGVAIKLNDAVHAQAMLHDIDFYGVTTKYQINATNSSTTNIRTDGV